MKMDQFVKNKMLYWFINKKVKGYVTYDYKDCILFVKPDINNNNELIKFDKEFILCKKIVDENINFNEDNN